MFIQQLQSMNNNMPLGALLQQTIPTKSPFAMNMVSNGSSGGNNIFPTTRRREAVIMLVTSGLKIVLQNSAKNI